MPNTESTYFGFDRQAHDQFVCSVSRDSADVKAFLGSHEDAASLLTGEPIAESEGMRHLIRCAQRYARASATILLTGESGTGKEILAQYIHQCSPRSAAPYVKVNCAALNDSLFESELFGHERGAFTGADTDRKGRFEVAAGGSLLLDEISEIPPRMQAKLLRVLEQEEFQRVGSNTNRAMTARIIATSNRNLEEDIEQGRFREDLYYRLNILHLHIPPLRQRRSDIPRLIELFVAKYGDQGENQVRGFSEGALQQILEHEWPGNVRQLRNIVHRACVLASGTSIEPADLLGLNSVPTRNDDDVFASGPLAHMSLDELERHAILASLDRSGGNQVAAAAQLGVSDRTLRNKLKQYRERGLA